MADAVLKSIGTILENEVGLERDAIHVAILPVVSQEEDHLFPGQAVKLVPGSQTDVVRAEGPEYGTPGIGIVDPFIQGYGGIKKGQMFWCFMYPGTIVGLRHHWHHPTVDTEVQYASDSQEWLKNFAFKWNMDYDELIDAASAPYDETEWGNYIVAKGNDLHSAGDLGEEHAEFWHHLSVLTGQDFSESHIENFGWSCSC